MKMILLLIGLMIGLLACAPRRVEVSVPTGEVVVGPETHHHSGSGKFCPPGHRMKGWC
jgi:hypothetical protein